MEYTPSIMRDITRRLMATRHRLAAKRGIVLAPFKPEPSTGECSCHGPTPIRVYLSVPFCACGMPIEGPALRRMLAVHTLGV